MKKTTVVNWTLLLTTSALLTSACGHKAQRSEEKNMNFIMRGEMPYVEQRFQECYRVEQERDPSLKGNVKIQFTVGSDGKPTEYSELRNAMSGNQNQIKSLSTCMRDVLVNSHFQSMESLGEDVLEIQYVAKFKPFDSAN